MRKLLILGIAFLVSIIFIVGFVLMPYMLSILQYSLTQKLTTDQSILALKWTSKDGLLTIYNVSATAIGGGILEVYMTINNTRQTEDKLIGCEVRNLTDVGWEIEVEGRRHLELEIPASSEIRLDYAIGRNFLNIYKRGVVYKYKPLASIGSTIDLALIFEKAGRINIKAPVVEWILD